MATVSSELAFSVLLGKPLISELHLGLHKHSHVWSTCSVRIVIFVCFTKLMSVLLRCTSCALNTWVVICKWLIAFIYFNFMFSFSHGINRIKIFEFSQWSQVIASKCIYGFFFFYRCRCKSQQLIPDTEVLGLLENTVRQHFMAVKSSGYLVTCFIKSGDVCTHVYINRIKPCCTAIFN